MNFRSILKNTFISAYQNRVAALQIASVWLLIVIVDAISGFASFCNINNTCFAETPDGSFEVNVGYVVYSILLAVAMIAISCAYIRTAILGNKTKYGQIELGLKELKFFGFALLFVTVLLMVAAITIAALAALLYALGVDLRNPLLLLIIITVPIISYAILFSRVYIKFAAIAIGDKNMTIRQAFALTKGNGIKIFFANFVISLPAAIVSSCVAMVFASSVTEAGGEAGFVVKFLYIAIALVVALVDTIIKSSYYAEIYKSFVNVVNTAPTEAQKDAEKVEVQKSEAPAKKAPAKKAPAKKAPAKTVAKKAPAKTVAKKAPAKTAAKKAPAKKAPAKKAAAKK